jgi:Nucleotidyl transferase AbiEii toxin, Type IV TA system
MPEAFLRLPLFEQAEILNGLAPELGRVAVVLEKDVWICWVLQQIFQMPGRLPMAFKGGTSLSKVFDAINRFSEDVDVTLDYRGFDTGIDPFDAKTSKSQIKKLSDSLKGFVRDHAHGVVAPYFADRLREQLESKHARVEISDNGEELRIYYPSALDQTPGYVGNSVLIELGGRNVTEPNAEHQVRPYIAGRLPGLDLPSAIVTVLSPARTFWEKATLIHVECHRPDLKADVSRRSRHWYDLALLADHDIGRQALADRTLLTDVVKHKKVFFGAVYANYDACHTGGLRLIPDRRLLEVVSSDLRAMINAGMFFGERPSFETITGRLRELEREINAGAS